MITIAIIGSSGSNGKMDLFSKEMFEKMSRFIEETIQDLAVSWDDVELWSGGSSGVDHLAVILFLKHKCKLRLCLPCKFENGQFFDNGNYSYKNNCGKLLNNLHSDFSRTIEDDTLSQLSSSIQMGAVVSTFEGFHKRNNEVSKADGMIAMTLESSIDGGTKYTWNKKKKIKCMLF